MKNEVNHGGLWCHEVLAALDDWVEEELSPEATESVRQHVSACARCASFGSRYARLVDALRKVEPDEASTLSGAFWERLRDVGSQAEN